MRPVAWVVWRPITGHCSIQRFLKQRHKEVLWAAQFEVNTSLHARFGNRSCNYHIGNYTDGTGVTRVQAYGRPFGTFKPTDFGYDVFTDKVNDSRYYKTFQSEYICNTTGSFYLECQCRRLVECEQACQ